jgi:inner membrane protein
MPSTERDGRPSLFVWLLAIASIVLPVVGVAAAIYGTIKIAQGAMIGWAWLGSGLGLLIADLVIDQKWYRWIVSGEPTLNRRGEQLIGQVVVVVEAIPREGRGSVRAADSVWQAEGVEAPPGARVRVSGCNGTVLTVGPA